MATRTKYVDWGGLTPIVDGIRVGATKPGQTGTELTGTEIALLDGITAGTVTASKAVVVDSNKDIASFRNVTATGSFIIGSADMNEADLEKLDGITNGTAAADKAVVLDASKGISTITSATITTLTSTTVNTTNLDAGASATAGTVDIFPTTAVKGKIQLAAADSAGDTTTTITNASQAGARTYTIPDAGASASFVMTEGAQTVNGIKTFGANPTLGAGITFDLDSATGTFSSNAVTITKYASQLTTESLTTAGGASQALVVTLTGVAATDLSFVQYAGGTNTTRNFTLAAVSTSNTVTITVYNNTAATALNGTIILNLWIVKA